jgi:hypothetical protein
LDKPHNGSNLQMSSLNDGSFWRKKGSLWQQNRGLSENISHFFLHFFVFLGFYALQAVAFQGQAAIKPPPKKSCLKTYGKFFVFFRL